MKLASAIQIVGGVLFAAAGALFALLNVGIYFIADCSAACEARGERTWVLALIAFGLVAAGGGLWMARRAWTRARAP